MSRTLHRIIEVRKSECKEQFRSYEDMVDELKDKSMVGDYYKVWTKNKNYIVDLDKTGQKYYKEVESIPSHWETVTYLSKTKPSKVYTLDETSMKMIPETKLDADGIYIKEDKNILIKENCSFCDCGGFIRDNYIDSFGWSDTGFKRRGLPKDAAAKTKSEIPDYCKGSVTYVGMEEWHEVMFDDEGKLETKNDEYISKLEEKETNQRLEYIENLMKYIAEIPDDKDFNIDDKPWEKDPDYEDDENDDLPFIKEEIKDIIFELEQIGGEIQKVYAYVDLYTNFDIISDEDIRIVYYIS